MLKFAVIAMGLMIVAGLAAVTGRVIYLASGPQKQAASLSAAGLSGASSAATVRSTLAPRLALPAQAIVKHVSLSGDRLAVHFETPAGAGIAIVDVASGAVLSRIDLVPEVPR